MAFTYFLPDENGNKTEHGTMRDKRKRGSLLGVIDKTKTSMGARMLISWLEKPLVNPIKINKRLYSVKELVDNPIMRDDIGDILNGIYDISRIVSRVSTNTLTPKDLISLKESLLKLPELEYQLSQAKSPVLSGLYEKIDIMEELTKTLDSAISDTAPSVTKSGDIIKKGYSEELEKIREAKDNSTGWMARIEAEEREKTGIKGLKTGYNKVFGYYIEILKSNTVEIPDRYIRKQTLTNAERYITPELKELEARIYEEVEVG